MERGAEGGVGGGDVIDASPPESPILTPRTGTLNIIGGEVRFWLHATFAPGWYSDAVREAAVSGADARRREILFAVCFVESYLLEWVRDEALHRDYKALDKYLPSDDRQGISERWKTVTKRLREDGLIPGHPDYGRASQWRDFIRLIRFRDGLVHGRTGRPQTTDTPDEALPSPTADDLTTMPSGWPTRTVVSLVRALHFCVGSSPPAWLVDPPTHQADCP